MAPYLRVMPADGDQQPADADEEALRGANLGLFDTAGTGLLAEAIRSPFAAEGVVPIEVEAFFSLEQLGVPLGPAYDDDEPCNAGVLRFPPHPDDHSPDSSLAWAGAAGAAAAGGPGSISHVSMGSWVLVYRGSGDDSSTEERLRWLLPGVPSLGSAAAGPAPSA